jgi:hypothetical protein
MATVRLGRFEVEQGRLPSVCMACGAPATVRKSKRFAWHPSWVWLLLFAGLLPLIIVAAILTKRMTLLAPFCEQHKRYFFLRNDAMGISLVLLVLLGCGGFLGVNQVADLGGSDWRGLYVFAVGGCLFAWLVFAAVVGQCSIRPTEITDHSITLVNVSEEFVKAVQPTRMAEDYPEVLPADPRYRGGSEEYFDPRKR